MSRRHIVEQLLKINDDADHLVFAFFHPWTIHCGKLGPMLERIFDRGFRLVAFRFHRITERDIELIYAANRPIDKNRSWFIPRQLYEMGPSCGVILYRPVPGESATQELKQLKGSSQPFLNSPGQLRYDFRPPNKSINLIHSSDSWESTIEEALVFLSPEEIEFVLRNVRRAPFDDNATRLLKHPAYTGIEIVREETATSLLLKLRIRALDLLQLQLEPDLCEPLFRFWNERLERDYFALTVHEEAKEYVSLVADEAPLLQPVLSALRSPAGINRPLRSLNQTPVAALAGLLAILSDPDCFTDADAEALLSIPVFLDRWEEQLFKTTLLHFDELRYCRS